MAVGVEKRPYTSMDQRPKPMRAHAKVAHVKVMISRPGVPSDGSQHLHLERPHERARVEVGHVVVDPLL
eukprot:scaffold23777_cov135-Isochrysis_galbana.AAC.2